MNAEKRRKNYFKLDRRWQTWRGQRWPFDGFEVETLTDGTEKIFRDVIQKSCLEMKEE